MKKEPLYPMNSTHPTDWVAEPSAGYRRLRRSGGYRKLKAFQVTTLIYDATVRFCAEWVDKYSRTVDQMVQAARSGRQNIAEGNRAGATSASSEIHLTNVARASLEELLLDYEDYLRQRGLPQWEIEDPATLEVRELARKADEQARGLRDASHRKRDDARMTLYSPWLKCDDPVKVANTVICLIHQANYLLDAKAAEMEREVIEKGGYREQLTAIPVTADWSISVKSAPISI
jgi:restriction system protein